MKKMLVLILSGVLLIGSGIAAKAEETKNSDETKEEEIKNTDVNIDTDDNFGPVLKEIFVFNKEKGINLDLLPTVSERGWENIVDVGQSAKDEIYLRYSSISWVLRKNEFGVNEWSLKLSRNTSNMYSTTGDQYRATYQTILTLFYRDYQWGQKNSNGMRDQLYCHITFAGTKADWNLEPDRPDVGSWATNTAGCNPR